MTNPKIDFLVNADSSRKYNETQSNSFSGSELGRASVCWMERINIMSGEIFRRESLLKFMVKMQERQLLWEDFFRFFLK